MNLDGSLEISVDSSHQYGASSLGRANHNTYDSGNLDCYVGLSDLPVPHPHDYDWRFNRQTIERLVRSLSKHVRANSNVLLLGTPSLATPLAHECPGHRIFLLDHSATLIQYLSTRTPPMTVAFAQHDMLSGHIWDDGPQMDAVVCDPPWYIEHYHAFLIQAASSTKVGADVLVSLLPENTRPGAELDRQNILEFAAACGLTVKAIKPNMLRYATPPFERTSMYAAHQQFDTEWRTADLLILTKTESTSHQYLTGLLCSLKRDAFDNSQWEEVIFGAYKVKLRGPFDTDFDQPELISIEDNDELPSVSRRYPGRQRIDLWLWDNRVFGVRGRVSLRAALRTLAGLPLDSIDKKVPVATVHMALDLLAPHLAPLRGNPATKRRI